MIIAKRKAIKYIFVMSILLLLYSIFLNIPKSSDSGLKEVHSVEILRSDDHKHLDDGAWVTSEYVSKKFLIEEQDFCKRHSTLKVIAYIHSGIKRVRERNITRHTWGAGLRAGVPLAVVFAVGNANSTEEEEIIRSESEQYHDIVQGDYVDAYRMLTYKALNALYWVTKNCAHVPWTMHADDDILVNDFKLMNIIADIESKKQEDSRTIYCNVYTNNPVFRTGLWAIPYKVYKNSTYPRHCQGPMWFMRTKHVQSLVKAADTTNFFWIDDVHITGFLAITAGIGRAQLPDLMFYYGDKDKKSLEKSLAWLVLDEDRYKWWNTTRIIWSNKWYLSAT